MESAKAEPEAVHWRSYHFIMFSRKCTWHLRFWLGIPRFWNLENVLYPKGSLRKQNQKGSTDGLFILLCVPERVLDIFVVGKEFRVSEIFEMFNPPKGSAKAHPMGSNWFSYSLLSLVNEK